MGTDDGTDSERPVHGIRLAAFYLDRFEVTNLEYETFPSAAPVRSAPSACDDCPVTRRNWYEADAYCRHRGKRLPTEAEWEKAARGPEGWNYSFADSADPALGHFARPLRIGAVSVDAMRPNGYGLHHMSGNVWEWVQDWFDPRYYGNSPRENPPGPESGFRKALRGGSWYTQAYYVHTGMRFALHPDTRLNSVGFRCARDAENTSGGPDQ